jgi:hypothetical protein
MKDYEVVEGTHHLIGDSHRPRGSKRVLAPAAWVNSSNANACRGVSARSPFASGAKHSLG